MADNTTMAGNTNIDTSSSSYAVTLPDPKDIKNPALRFAMMELTTAKIVREQATSKLNLISDTQRAQRSANSYLDEFRKRQNDAATGHGNKGKDYVTMDQWQLDWLRAHNIKYPSKADGDKPDMHFSADEWDLVCKGCQNYIESLGSRTQTTMVQAQDALGQYNAHTQGSTSSINSSIEMSSITNKTQPF